MATFKIGDYVEVCHRPDLKWVDWDNDTHTTFCRKVGIIEDIEEDEYHPDDRTEDLIKVVCYFDEHELGAHVAAGNYFQMFKTRHLIKSSAYAIKRLDFAKEAAQETNHYEDFTKNKRDEIFKYIFGIKENRNSVREISNEEYNAELDDWEMKTPVMDLDYDPYL